jgi:hypothetical protein
VSSGNRCAKGKPAELSYDDPNLRAELAALPEIKRARVWKKLGINRKRLQRKIQRTKAAGSAEELGERLCPD